MDYFSWMQASFFGGIRESKPKDPNSNSALRGYEKRLAKLLLREQTPKVVTEIKKLHKKIEAQKEKIRKRNDETKRSQQ